MFTSLRRRLPRLGRLPRLCGVGICLLLAAQSAAAGSTARNRGANGPTVAVVVARHALGVGHVLTAGDVRVARWPAALRLTGSRAAPTAVVGRRLAAPVGAREAVTATRLLGPDLATGLDGLVAAAVPVADEHALDLLRPGDRVDLLSTARVDDLVTAPRDPTTETVGRAIRVLALFRGDGEGTGAEVVLAVSRSTAVAISRAGPTHVFTAVLGPP